MAKALLLCFRHATELGFSAFMDAISRRIRPDNAVVTEPYVYQDGRLCMYVFNPSASVSCRNGSVCLGVTRRADADSLEVGAPPPDGTFALFRSSVRHVEIVSDYTASRTIWFHRSEDLFMASTSQRLMVAFLGDFVPNQKAFAWMLATGTLGPGFSWDRRLEHVPPNTRVVLNRAAWRLTVHRPEPLAFEATARSMVQHRQRLETAVRESISDLNYGDSPWTLALSGGVDSRSVLYHLRERRHLDTITWGLGCSMGRRRNDATIAKTLSDMCHVDHTYAATDIGADPATVFERFLGAGEGRIDHLSGYMDGLRIWSDLCSSRRGLIRGYDALGTKPVTPVEGLARRVSGLALTADYLDSFVPRELEVTEEDVPSALVRRPAETLHQWRDRLWLEFRTPFVTAALDGIKEAYVEVANPLLFRGVVRVVQTLPDELRTDKRLFREIVADMFPGVPFATSVAVQPLDEILDTDLLRRFMRDDLVDAGASHLLPRDFIAYLATNLDTGYKGRFLRRRLRGAGHRLLPESLRRCVRARHPVRAMRMDVRRQALRTIIIVRMNRILCEDAATGRAARADVRG